MLQLAQAHSTPCSLLHTPHVGEVLLHGFVDKPIPSTDPLKEKAIQAPQTLCERCKDSSFTTDSVNQLGQAFSAWYSLLALVPLRSLSILPWSTFVKEQDL